MHTPYGYSVDSVLRHDSRRTVARMMWRYVLRARAVVFIASLVLACGGTGDDITDPTDPGPGALVFRAAPIDTARILMIIPLGNINPRGHTLPTDHIYFRVADPNGGQTPEARRTAFFAPGDGIVRDVIPHPPLPDVKVILDHHLLHRSPDS